MHQRLDADTYEVVVREGSTPNRRSFFVYGGSFFDAEDEAKQALDQHKREEIVQITKQEIEHAP